MLSRPPSDAAPSLQKRFLGWAKSPKQNSPDPDSPDHSKSSKDKQVPKSQKAASDARPTATVGLGFDFTNHNDDNRLVHFNTNPVEAVLELPASDSLHRPTPPARTSPKQDTHPTTSNGVHPLQRRGSNQSTTNPQLSTAGANGIGSVRVSPFNPSSQSRTTSPLSFAHTGQSPYGWSATHSSLARLAEQDQTQLHQPITWSELANPDLVDNVSARERIRQEILSVLAMAPRCWSNNADIPSMISFAQVGGRRERGTVRA